MYIKNIEIDKQFDPLSWQLEHADKMNQKNEKNKIINN